MISHNLLANHDHQNQKWAPHLQTASPNPYIFKSITPSHFKGVVMETAFFLLQTIAAAVGKTPPRVRVLGFRESARKELGDLTEELSLSNANAERF